MTELMPVHSFSREEYYKRWGQTNKINNSVIYLNGSDKGIFTFDELNTSNISGIDLSNTSS
jgi:hypothetical protein